MAILPVPCIAYSGVVGPVLFHSFAQVAIPLNCVSGMAPQINPKLDVERYLQVVTADGFDFWFTGFLNYDSAFATLLGALHDVGRHTDSLLKGAS